MPIPLKRIEEATAAALACIEAAESVGHAIFALETLASLSVSRPRPKLPKAFDECERSLAEAVNRCHQSHDDEFYRAIEREWLSKMSACATPVEAAGEAYTTAHQAALKVGEAALGVMGYISGTAAQSSEETYPESMSEEEWFEIVREGEFTGLPHQWTPSVSGLVARLRQERTLLEAISQEAWFDRVIEHVRGERKKRRSHNPVGRIVPEHDARSPTEALEKEKAVTKPITAAVAAQRYEVTVKQLREAAKGRVASKQLTDLRPKNHPPNALLLLDEDEIRQYWPLRQR